MVLKKEPENVHVIHRCMYVPLISEITLDNFLFGYLNEIRGSINAFIYKSNGGWPNKRRDVIITMGQFTIPPKVIPADEYHFYTICTLSRSNPPPPPTHTQKTKLSKPGTSIGHHSLCTSFIHVYIFFTLWKVWLRSKFFSS